MHKVRRVLATLLTGALILGTGVIGIVFNARANARAEATRRDDREGLQTTLAGLATQYLVFALKDETTVAFNGPWQLRPDDPADRSRLQGYVTQSALLTYGAAVVGLDSRPLTEYAPNGALPPPSDPAYKPLVSGLLNNQPGLSAVAHVGNVPVVALGVPVLVNGTPKAVFVGFFRADQGPLETYVEGLKFQGHTGRTYIVDASGTVVAATNPKEVGTHLEAGAAMTDLLAGRAGFREYHSSTGGTVASYTPITIGGWGTMTTQTSNEFFGSIRRGHHNIEIALIALLALASLVIVLLGYRQEVARRRYQERLAHLAHHDSLTDLPNRVMFNNQLVQALSRARRNDGDVALLFVDLDGFKQANDAYGHAFGDAILVEVGDRLRRCIRDGDTVARVGGDEFTVIMEGVADAGDAAEAAVRIIDAVGQAIVVDGVQTTVGASVGIAYSRGGHDSADGLARDADLAMYQAKDGGKARYQFFGEPEQAVRAARPARKRR